MKKKLAVSLCVFAAVAAAFSAYVYIGNTTLDVDEYIISSDEIPPGFDSFRIVQLSDLHDADPDSFSNGFFEQIRSCEPDIIVITGDAVTSYPPSCGNVINMLGELTDIADVYFVSGNHEAREPEQYARLLEAFDKYCVRVLDNEAVTLNKDGDSVNLIGITDPIFFGDMDKRRKIIEDKMASLTEDGMYNIMLFHHPEYIDEIAASGTQLAFCGHAHGGQFILPFIGGLVAPGQGLFPEYTEGVYAKGETQMVVSRGIGRSAFPFRVNNNPEIVCVILKKFDTGVLKNDNRQS